MDIDPTTKKFLVASNSASGLCVACHNKQYWTSNPSTHMTSTKAYAAAQGAHTGYTTVATNGCESCHKPHTATVAPARAQGAGGVDVSAVPRHDGHRPEHPDRVHEGLRPSDLQPSRRRCTTRRSRRPARRIRCRKSRRRPPRHAECEDCHNSHASYALTATAPKGSGQGGRRVGRQPEQRAGAADRARRRR